MNRWVLRVIIGLMVFLAACGTDNPPTDTDWCFRYVLTGSDYGAAFVNGSYVGGVGFVTDGSGQLGFTIGHAYTVKPAHVVITADRGIESSGDIHVEGSGEVFGIDADVNVDIPSILSTGQISYDAPSSTTSGNGININLEASQQIAIRTIEIRGYYDNPFLDSNCESVSETPTMVVIPPTETPEPSETPLSTETSIPTETAYPTPTPAPDWCRLFAPPAAPYFSLNSEAGATFGTISGGLNSQVANAWESVGVFDLTFLNSATVVEIYYEGVVGTPSTGVNRVHFRAETIFVSSFVETPWDDTVGGVQWNGSQVISNRIVIYIYSDGLGDISIPLIRIKGNGTNPFGTDNCTSPTPTPSLTRTPTWTRTPTITRTPTPTRTGTLTPSTSVGGGGTATPSRTRTPSRTPIVVSSRTRTPTGTATGSATATVMTNTGTPFFTRTTAPTVSPYPSSTPGGVPDMDDENAPEIEILGVINEFFYWSWNTSLNFFDWLRTLIAWLLGSAHNVGIQLGNILTGIGGFFSSLVSGVQEIGDIIGLLGAIGTHLFDLAGSWLSQIGSLPADILTQWYVADVTPIPYLPRCVTAPLESDICAFYYVVEFTLLGGTLGNLIMPLLTTLLDMAIIFYFIGALLRLLSRAERVTE